MENWGFCCQLHPLHLGLFFLQVFNKIYQTVARGKIDTNVSVSAAFNSFDSFYNELTTASSTARNISFKSYRDIATQPIHAGRLRWARYGHHADDPSKFFNEVLQKNFCRFFKVWRDILNFSVDTLQRSHHLSGDLHLIQVIQVIQPICTFPTIEIKAFVQK